MSGELSRDQICWLRGLALAKHYVLMSASELGNPEVSTLQALGLVQISNLRDGYNWRITETGMRRAQEHADG